MKIKVHKIVENKEEDLELNIHLFPQDRREFMERIKVLGKLEKSNNVDDISEAQSYFDWMAEFIAKKSGITIEEFNLIPLDESNKIIELVRNIVMAVGDRNFTQNSQN